MSLSYSASLQNNLWRSLRNAPPHRSVRSFVPPNGSASCRSESRYLWVLLLPELNLSERRQDPNCRVSCGPTWALRCHYWRPQHCVFYILENISSAAHTPPVVPTAHLFDVFRQHKSTKRVPQDSSAVVLQTSLQIFENTRGMRKVKTVGARIFKRTMRRSGCNGPLNDNDVKPGPTLRGVFARLKHNMNSKDVLKPPPHMRP
jgi:hypothetical protein